MPVPIYRFRNFRLDPQAHELYQDDELVALPLSTLDCLTYLIQHRARTVGRDELTAAVWGRADVSDVSLSHAVMRLRRLLGDTGTDQNCIRTVQRLGYRWVLEPTLEEVAPAAPVEPNAGAITGPAPPAPAAPPPPIARSGARRWGFVALLLAIVAICLLALPPVRQRGQPPTAGDVKRVAMVLPATVEAPEEWAWLRLGFMDLVANRLRQGNLPTTPSETVVALVDAHALDSAGAGKGSDTAADTRLLIQPRVTFANGLWNVRLEARGGGRQLLAETQSKDVLAGGRATTDELLLKLGHTPPASTSTEPPEAAEELMQRVSAAVLAGQLETARALIENAPAAARDSPDIALSTASIEFFSGEYEASRKHGEALLDRLPAATQPRLRARVLNRLGATYFRQNRYADADAAFSEAIGLLSLQNEPDVLATAYTGRGAVAGQAQRLDEAAALFGQARTLHQMSNDAFGVARVDLNLGAIAMDRGQPAAAVPVFRDAAERFETLATPEARNSALRSLADAQSMLLEHDQALATTERFWPPEAHNRNPREGWWLTLSRAVALTGVGRLREAEALLEHVRRDSDPDKDAVARLEAEAVLADLALLRGNPAAAATTAAAALTPALESTNWQDYTSTWFTRVRALQRSGQLDAAATEVRRLREWARRLPGDRCLLYAILAEADQANAEGGRDAALRGYADAMARAERLGIPEDLVTVGESYVPALLAAGQVDQGSAVGGRLAQWADKDVRAAWVQAQVFQAMGKSDAARITLARARQLSGERALPGEIPTATAGR